MKVTAVATLPAALILPNIYAHSVAIKVFLSVWIDYPMLYR